MSTKLVPALTSALRQIEQAVAAGKPGAGDVFAEVQIGGDDRAWAQVQLEVINLGWPSDEEPLALLRRTQIALLPGLEVIGLKARTFATFRYGPCPVVEIAGFVDRLLRALHEVDADVVEVNVLSLA